MKMSTLLVPTSKDKPSGVRDSGLSRLIRAGYVAYDRENDSICLLPLAIIARSRLISIVSRVLNDGGFQEIGCPEEKDGGVRVTELLLKSHKQLPMKFMEVREDAVDLTAVFASSAEGEHFAEVLLEELSVELHMAGLDVEAWEESSCSGRRLCAGPRGKKGGRHLETGFDCPSCGWRGSAHSPLPRPGIVEEAEAAVEEIYTPGAGTIAELCSMVDVEPARTVKTMFLAADGDEGTEIFAVLIRGDRQISTRKLVRHLGVHSVRRADDEELRSTVGDLAGYLGPVGLPDDLRVVADWSVEGGKNMVVGANRPDYHLRGVCWGRDFTATSTVDLAEVEDRCPLCGGALEKVWRRPLAEIRLSDAEAVNSGLLYDTASGEKASPCCWRGTISLEQILLAITPDDPESLSSKVAPFDVQIVISSLRKREIVDMAEALCGELVKRGVRVLLDDRDIKAGGKFFDAELMGIPCKVIVGRDAPEGFVELWHSDGRRQKVGADEVVNILIKGDNDEENR